MMNSLSILLLILSFTLTVLSSSLSQQCAGSNQTCQLLDTCCNFKGKDNTGCCPLSNAVCCKDLAHCCPQGYKCSDSPLLCERPKASPVRKTQIQQHTIPLRRLEKYVSKQMIQGVECDDQISWCADGDTCCKLESGMWGCCPLTNARCCEDGEHCCPKYYECTKTDGLCNQTVTMYNHHIIPAGIKQKAMHIKDFIAKQLSDAMCADVSECIQKHSCCELEEEENYGCSEVSNAICCADRKSWCPEGYSCDLSQEECKQVTIEVEHIDI
ncbi:Kielin/chordin-like protein isoform X2 [Oopsacas minuta]|uniref:Kielin/chordin-like protein isoform X2 n=1 Tax=Oopsacas minuta TaxID=111878 RepID=A0AAV7JL69_9METZ|nr:Kielin/chordin-like protein isoform X2 [Oopsacas minuta]